MNGTQKERRNSMNYENRRLFEEIMKAKARFGDDEFEAELSKLMHNFEVKEIVREDGESDILQHLEWYLEGKRFDGITEGTLENYERAVTKFAEAYP